VALSLTVRSRPGIASFGEGFDTRDLIEAKALLD
jgi:hypothetical protein